MTLNDHDRTGPSGLQGLRASPVARPRRPRGAHSQRSAQSGDSVPVHVGWPAMVSATVSPAEVNSAVAEGPADQTAVTRPRLQLAQLSGVQESDSPYRLPDLGAATHDRPRLTFSPRSVLAALLILVCALAACLTLLFQQSANLAGSEGLDASKSLETAPAAGAGSATGAKTAAEPGSAPADSAAAGSATGSGGASRGSGDAATTDSTAPAPAGAAGTAGVPAGKPGTDPTGQAPSTAQSPGSQPVGPQGDTRVDINSATVDQLESIKGVGPVTAQKIVDYRSAHGRFSQVEGLLNVSGIGVKTLEKMRAYVVAR